MSAQKTNICESFPALTGVFPHGQFATTQLRKNRFVSKLKANEIGIYGNEATWSKSSCTFP